MTYDEAEKVVFDTMARRGYTEFTAHDIYEVILTMPLSEYAANREAFATWYPLVPGDRQLDRADTEMNGYDRTTGYLIGISFAVSIAAIIISIVGMLR